MNIGIDDDSVMVVQVSVVSAKAEDQKTGYKKNRESGLPFRTQFVEERNEVEQGEQNQSSCGGQTPLINLQHVGYLLGHGFFRLKESVFLADQLKIPFDVGITRRQS